MPARGFGKRSGARVIYWITDDHRILLLDVYAKNEVARVRQSLDLSQEAFASMLGIGLSTLRSWEQNKRQPSGAARMLISIALKHPEVLLEAVV